MHEKTKPKKDNGNDSEKDAKKEVEEIAPERKEIDEKGNWSEDQQEKSYYYDDSYGYEVYVPNEEDEESEKGK